MRTPSRITQVSCATAGFVGLIPWGFLTPSLINSSISSATPLTMSVATWLVVLVPIWVGWFAVMAWDRRDVSSVPAVLMAVPAIVVTALLIALPLAVGEP